VPGPPAEAPASELASASALSTGDWPDTPPPAQQELLPASRPGSRLQLQLPPQGPYADAAPAPGSRSARGVGRLSPFQAGQQNPLDAMMPMLLAMTLSRSSAPTPGEQGLARGRQAPAAAARACRAA
jgi:hypothetical protein